MSIDKPYINLKLDQQFTCNYFDVKIYLESTPVIRCYFFNNNIPLIPSGYTANLAYSSDEITHDYTTMEGTITNDYCDFDIQDDFFTATGDYYAQIYLTKDTEQIVIANGYIRVLECLFS